MSSDSEHERDPRVFLAIDRTFLAWTRTSLASMGFGFVVARLGIFLREIAYTQGEFGRLSAAASTGQAMQSMIIGTVLVILGVVIQCLALVEHRQQTRAFKRGGPVVPSFWSLAQVVGICLLAVGVGMAAYLVALY